MPDPADHSTLLVREVDQEFGEISALAGKGSTTERRHRFRTLLARASAPEQRLLAGLVAGELRQGALDGVLTEAVAHAGEVPAADVRRAITVAGALVPVAEAVLTQGLEGLDVFRLTVGSPIRPMLASPSTGIDDAMEQILQRTDTASVETKYDGIRVQAHKRGDEITIFTRTLDDITSRVPDLVEAVAAVPAEAVVLDGEAIALTSAGRPHAFQVTASRTMRSANADQARTETPLSVYWFDCLHLNGSDLIGDSAAERWAMLASVVPPEQLVPRLHTADPAAATQFYTESVAAGHEGVIVKAPDAEYQAGRRGASWLKVKPRHTLDLVILAVEWGHGRRTGKLSNLHLGARDPEGKFGPPGGFVMLGKTFKGLTDAMLEWQTKRFLELADGPTDSWVVKVKPEMVAEIAFDGVQNSPRYPAGVALRFARVLHYREDKSSTDTDTIDSVLDLRP
jgi:DNA ligase-1